MKHIPSKSLDSAGVRGEISIDDYGIFTDGGSLKRVAQFWEATVSQALLLAEANECRLAALEPAKDGKKLDTESEVYREGLLETHVLANEYLVPATIFALLLGFYEYALIEVYKLVLPQKPLPKRPQLVGDIIKPLEDEGIVKGLPNDYETYVQDHRDIVRNAFAHGRWEDLKSAAQGLKFHEAFGSVASYFLQVEENLKNHQQKFRP